MISFSLSPFGSPTWIFPPDLLALHIQRYSRSTQPRFQQLDRYSMYLRSSVVALAIRACMRRIEMVCVIQCLKWRHCTQLRLIFDFLYPIALFHFEKWRKKSFPTFLPQKVIDPDVFSHSVKELIVWSPERFRARKKHPAARSIDRGTRSYVFMKVHPPKRSLGSCKCDSWKFIGGEIALSNEEKQLHPIRRVKMDTNRWKRSQ